MNRITPILLYLQTVLGRLCFFMMGPLVVMALKVMRYRVKDLQSVRKVAEDLFEEHQGPWLICPNHLTMIDSIIVAYALVPFYRYMIRYRVLPWNLPESENFQRNIVLSVFCYLMKCIPISRGGDRETMKKTLDKCMYLLRQGENLLVFSEGGRSRTGRIDTENFSYGVGRFVHTIQDCRVMCIYLRGDGQETYSNIPRFAERFTMKIEAIKPFSDKKGLKGQRDCAKQIVEQLARMEEDYFESCGQRHCGSDRPPIEGEKPGYAVH
jgi:1-acyl-sn-glycerol-3-phosphate acyltransferase